MGKIVSSLLGGLLGSAPKATSPAPVSSAPAATVTEDSTATKAARAALYATQGGANGEVLSPDQVQKRPTLLGN